MTTRPNPYLSFGWHAVGDGLVSPTIFVGVYGSLQLHSWITAETVELEEDAYSLFMSRSISMGWSTAGGNDLTKEPLWGMNEAEIDRPTDNLNGRIAWFQVGVSDRFDARPLPVLPILACADDALNRVGEVHLDALQVFLPMHDDGDAAGHLVSGLNWFAICDPDARTSVRITIDGGDDSAVHHRAADILATLQQINTGAFHFDSISIDDSMVVDPIPAVVDERWLVRGHPRLTLVATTPEWSVDALGWIVALVAAVCGPSGRRPTPGLISIGRN